MQQLMVGDGRSANAQGPVSGAPMRSSTADWRWALSELDGEEQAEWERVIRCLPTGTLPRLHGCAFSHVVSSGHYLLLDDHDAIANLLFVCSLGSHKIVCY